jgi:hypothetical protein
MSDSAAACAPKLGRAGDRRQRQLPDDHREAALERHLRVPAGLSAGEPLRLAIQERQQDRERVPSERSVRRVSVESALRHRGLDDHDDR